MSVGFNHRNHTDLSLVLFFALVISALFYQAMYDSSNLVNATAIAIAFSIVTVGISYDSYKLNRANHRLALFDKRYKVYAALKDLLVSITREGRLLEDVFSDFREKHSEAQFLFQKDILDYFNEIKEQVIKFEDCQGMSRALEDKLEETSAERIKRIKREEKEEILLVYFRKELEECEGKFLRYLSFREI